MEKRAVLVTGASSGIGEVCALDLAKAGFTVFAGVRKPVDGERLRVAGGGAIIPLLLDVTSDSQIEDCVAAVESKLDGAKLAGIVNNAGIVVAGPLELLSSAHLREQMEINVIGAMAVTRAFLPMLRQSGGRIVNMSSVSGKIGNPLIGAYCASKFALEALSDVLRIELAPWNIQVALIEPGMVATPIWERSSIGFATRVGSDPLLTSLYGKLKEGGVNMITQSSKKAAPPSHVSKAVLHALTAHRARTRYVIGRDAMIGLFLKHCLPTRWMDKLIRLAMGI